MPILRKKASRKLTTKKAESRNDTLVGDVTIDDFANTCQVHRRLKKAVTNIGYKQVCNKAHEEAIIQEQKPENWEETNGSLLEDITRGKNNKVMSLTSSRRTRKSTSQQDNVEEEEVGIDYPLDIWFIISEYIRPEAVGQFARICKSSYYVTTTAKFWFHLYKIYYKFVPNLPERLRPQCMVRQHGLRACVIRALYYCYFTSLLQREIDNVSYLRQDQPHSLVKRRCTLMWHKEGKVRWYFFFKLKEISNNRNSSLQHSKQCNTKKTEFLEMLEDVAVNPEEGCKVLKVTCLKYSMLPPVIGLILQTVSMNLERGFREHRLQLGFGTSNIPNTLTNQVILNDVTGYRILDWWDPFYPHQDINFTMELSQSHSWD